MEFRSGITGFEHVRIAQSFNLAKVGVSRPRVELMGTNLAEIEWPPFYHPLNTPVALAQR